MHDDTLAAIRRVEAAEIAFLGAAVGAARRRGTYRDAFVEAVHDGVAFHVAAGWPLNKILGLGLVPSDDPRHIVAAVDALADRAEVPVELSDAAAPDLAAALDAAGHHEVEREVVSVLDPRAVTLDGAAGVTCEPVTAATERAWVETSIAGFAVPADGPAHTEFPAAILEQVFTDRRDIAGTTCWLAHVDGQVAGAGAVHVEGDVALLCGATTLPAFRRRGVQTTLLAARLDEARARGCTTVVVTTPEGSASAASVRTAGFEALHVRRLLERRVRAPQAGRTP